MGFLFLWLALVSPNAAQAVLVFTPDKVESIGQSQAWKGLLQYQKNFLGFEKSEVDGANFFLAPDGKKNSVSELQSTLAAFQNPIVKDEKGEDNEHPICRFPARYQFLSRHFDLSQLTLPRCPSFAVYRERIQNKKVSVVFTSYYAGSASSVFGHSFLKFSGNNENELFDTGINFAANPTTSNPILYSLYGLIGVFPSSFSAQPFYYKVREYNDFESRDLWSYELKLTPAQRQILISHLWELGGTYYDYFYLSENCSYQILRAIEGAIPEIRFFERRLIYLIPSESIKLLYRIPGLVGDISYRPSIRNVTFHGFDLLTVAQKSELMGNLRDRSQISDDTEVVDVLIDAVDLNYAEKIKNADPETLEWKDRILKKRAGQKRLFPSSTPAVPENDKPSVGHGTRRLSLGLDNFSGRGQSESGFTFRARASHHDLLDPSVGYPRHLHIDFGRVGFRYLNQSKRFMLEDLTLVDLTALSLEHPLYSRWSYAVKIGYSRRWFTDCNDAFYCPAVSVKAGFGKTYPLLKRHAFFALLNFEPSYSHAYQDSKFRLSIMPSLNLLFEWNAHFKSQFQVSSSYHLMSKDAWLHAVSLETRYVWSNRFGLDLDVGFLDQASHNQKRVGVSALYYF